MAADSAEEIAAAIQRDRPTPPEEATSVDGIARGSAVALAKAGYETIDDILRAEVAELEAVQGVGSVAASNLKAEFGDIEQPEQDAVEPDDTDERDDQEDDGPEWNGRDPEAIVADSSLPARVVLDDILDAVAAADTLIEAAESLDVDVDNLEPVCWQLTLKRPESYEVVDDVDEQIAKIREVAA
jgi:hypothetical protein